MLKLLTVVGARPQFIKAAPVSRAIRGRAGGEIDELLVHTGQHYDDNMSRVFFDQLGVPRPAHDLGISGGGHGEMTGRMLAALERVLVDERPDWVLVYGDTNSTLAAALAAAKLHIPVAHVEAGLRSFNMRMPEEINRIVADRLASLLLCPTETAVANLRREGITSGVHLVGDVMYDLALLSQELMARPGEVLERYGLSPRGYVLATCHRAENTDCEERLTEVLRGLATVAESRTVLLPLHPRTRSRVEEYGLEATLGALRVVEPVSYLDMVALQKNAAVIVTDSGGVQKEAFFHRVPCVTMRDETEWLETLDSGWNILAGADATRIADAVAGHGSRPKTESTPYGEGDAAERIVDLLASATAAADTRGPHGPLSG